MSTHRTIAFIVHEEDAEVGFGSDGLCYDAAIHVIMSTRLPHQCEPGGRRAIFRAIFRGAREEARCAKESVPPAEFLLVRCAGRWWSFPALRQRRLSRVGRRQPRCVR